ncbi:DMT family transporter [Streptomyces sp. SID10853]|uniref:DMT family transporter n=1 Tax=Streptomyces sp. SID10853 TaxID=2706028 RepID=UPI0013BFB8A3|nr:DMT family transporter [Streptomyces sp. SID10853]NDZ79991.1 DMT family transporter [Streptomyces sp. SID10853]
MQQLETPVDPVRAEQAVPPDEPAPAAPQPPAEGAGERSARAVVWLGPVLATLATLIWSGNFVIARALHEDVAPVQTAFWRWIIAMLAVLPFAAKAVWQQRHLIRTHLKYLSAAALLGVTLFNTLIYQAGRSTSATNLALIAAASPVLIVLFGMIGRGGEKVTGRRAIGMMVALVGVVALVSKGSLSVLLHLDFAVGDLWMLAATATFAGYTALLRRRPEGISGISFLFTTFLLGTVLLAPAYAVSLAAQGGFTPSGGTVGALLYIGVASSAIAYFTWNKAIDLIGAARAGIIYYLQPVFVAVVSYLALGEATSAMQVVCMALIITGIALGAGKKN